MSGDETWGCTACGTEYEVDEDYPWCVRCNTHTYMGWFRTEE